MALASNTFVNNSLLAKVSAKALRNKAVFYSRIRNDVAETYKVPGYQSGDTISIKLPPRYVSATGAAISKNNTVQTTVTLTVAQRNIGIGATSQPLTTTIDGLTQFLEPLMAQLMTDFDKDAATALYYGAENLVTPGAISATTGPAAWTGADVSTRAPLGQARARLTEKAIPDDGKRYGALTPSAMAAITDTNASLFNPVMEIANQFKTGLLGTYNGIQWVESALLPRHTTGTRTNVTPLVDGASQVGASLLLKGAGNTVTVTKGDQFVLAGVNAINPLTRVSTGKLQVFTVTANGTTSAGGAITLAIAPAINVTSPGQTVSATAADGATVTWMGAASTSTDVNLVWHEEGGVACFLPLTTDFPGADAAQSSEPDTGVAVRVMKQGNIETDEVVWRADILYAFAKVRGEAIVRVQA
jgi:hypothetical protein